MSGDGQRAYDASGLNKLCGAACGQKEHGMELRRRLAAVARGELVNADLPFIEISSGMTSTIPSLLRAAAQTFKDKAALASLADGPFSFAALDAAADRVASAQIADGMAAGTRVAIWAPNMWEWVAAAVGTQRAGNVIVPLNTRLRGGEVSDIVRRARVTHLFSIGTFLGRYYPAMLRSETMPGLRRVIVLRTERTLLGGIEEDWNVFLDRGDTLDPALLCAREAAITAGTLADIMFTSGTTGAPKGAVFDHRRSIGGGQAWNDLADMEAHHSFCCFGPFSHNASYKAGWLAGLLKGFTVSWTDSYDAAALLDLIAKHRITHMPAPPTIWQEILNHPNWRDWDTSSLTFVSTGGTTVPIELMRRLQTEMGVAMISTGYGMTECCGSATHTRAGDDLSRTAYTVGTAVAGTEIRIADARGRPLPTGEAGEVLIRNASLLIEYLDNPEATSAAIDAEGWLHSGDIGVLDADGYLKITDRMKDMYIVGGFNVYPAEIERQMNALDGILHCAVIGVPDERLGEVGQAFIVRAPHAALSEADVLAWSKANLANYKIPRKIVFVDELPRNASGKVVKFELRKLA